MIFKQGLNGYTGTIDTCLKESAPTTKLGQHWKLGVDMEGGSSKDKQVLLEFSNLFGDGPNQIPEGARITSATLTLRTMDKGDGAALHRMLTSWSESDTWASFKNGIQADGKEALAQADLVMGKVAVGTSIFNVTKSVQAWADGAANHGWAFLSRGMDGWDFFSSESAFAPVLTVKYADGGNPVQPRPPVPVKPFNGSVNPSAETGIVAGFSDVADDPAIWVNRANPSRSVVIGTDKDEDAGGLYVFDLQGKEIDRTPAGHELNNVDVRYGFKLGNASVDLVGATNRATGRIEFFAIDPQTRELKEVGSVPTGLSNIYGFAMSHSPNGKYYAYVSNTGAVEDSSADTQVRQFVLDGSNGTIKGTAVRTLNLGSQAEGLVADDEKGTLYVAEEDVGIWKYGANPASGARRTQVDKVGGGRIAADVEGLAIYYGANGAGYLIASSQGSDSYAVYDRAGGNDYRGTFRIAGSGGIDGTSDTDGLDVINLALGPGYSKGMLVAHDNDNSGGSTSNFKLVQWEDIAQLGRLTINSAYDGWLV